MFLFEMKCKHFKYSNRINNLRTMKLNKVCKEEGGGNKKAETTSENLGRVMLMTCVIIGMQSNRTPPFL